MNSNLLKAMDAMQDGFSHHVDRYRSNANCFTLIKISGACVEHSLDDIIQDLSVLQEFDLYPAVIFGWGDTLSRKMTELGLTPEFKDGIRVTDVQTMTLINQIVQETFKQIESYSNRLGLKISDLTKEKIFISEKQDGYGLVGNVTGIDKDKILSSIHSGRVPFIAPIGHDGTSFLNINADEAARSLVLGLNPSKYIAMTATGGILDRNGEIISKISILEDYSNIVQDGYVTNGMLKKLNEAKKVLSENGPPVQITSPQNLLKELFTYNGAGTKIINGYTTKHHESFQDVNLESLRNLIESSFKKKLSNEYFGNDKMKYLVIEEDYDGVAIVEGYKDWEYLDKLAVRKDVNGMGLGDILFSKVAQFNQSNMGNQRLFWRADCKNPINHWYNKIISRRKGGCSFGDEWNVYWIGTGDLDHIIDYARKKEVTLQ